MPISLYFTLFTHELSHAIAAKLYGWKIIKFRPWPKVRDGKVIYWGIVVVAGSGDPPRIFYSSPVVKSVLVAFMFLHLADVTNNFVYISFVVTEVGDIISWFSSGNKKDSDFYKWKKSKNEQFKGK